MTKIKTLLFVAIGLGLLTGAGLGLASRGTAGDQQTASAAANTDWVAAVGKTEGAREELALRSEITGTIHVMSAKTNQDVRKGDLLVELENAGYRAQVSRAEAQVRRREADCDRARDTYTRLVDSKTGASRADVKQAESALHAAKADWDMAKAELQQAQAAQAKTRLLAPWDGRVLRVFEEPGALVGPTSARPILLMADVSRRRVRAFIEELDALRVREGQPALVTVDGAPGKEFTGRISEVLLRMDRDATHSDRPGEYEDVYHRPVLIDLDDGRELPLNQRVDIRIQVRGGMAATAR